MLGSTHEIESIVGFWLDLGTDGFRLDATTYYYGGNTAKTRNFFIGSTG